MLAPAYPAGVPLASVHPQAHDVLVVIDMQPCFSAACDPRVISAVAEEIIAAKARRESIVVLELVSPAIPPQMSPRTHQRLLNILEDEQDPARWVLKFKATEDGSAEVVEACRLFRQIFGMPFRFRLCGVNTRGCVFETAVGLLTRQPGCTVEVIARAVNDTHPNPWQRYRAMGSHRLSVV